MGSEGLIKINRNVMMIDYQPQRGPSTTFYSIILNLTFYHVVIRLIFAWIYLCFRLFVVDSWKAVFVVLEGK